MRILKPTDTGSWDDPMVLAHLTVFEPDEPEATHARSSLLGPDGEPIIYRLRPTRQGFLGFIDFREPEELEEDEED